MSRLVVYGIKRYTFRQEARTISTQAAVREGPC